MTEAEYNKYTNWYCILEEIQKEYPGNINIGTIITSLKAKTKEYKRK
jgi:hypothetical protein